MTTILRVRPPKKTFQISSGRSAGLWMRSLKRGSPPRLVDSYWVKGAAIMVRHDELTKDCQVTYPRGLGWLQA